MCRVGRGRFLMEEWFGAIAGIGDRAHDGGVMILR